MGEKEKERHSETGGEVRQSGRGRGEGDKSYGGDSVQNE